MAKDNIIPMPRLVAPCEITPSELLNNEAFVVRLRATMKDWVGRATPADIGWMYSQIACREQKKEAARRPRSTHLK